MEEITIEEMLAAIRAQGKRIRTDATEEQIREKYATLSDDAQAEEQPATESKKIGPKVITEYDAIMAAADPQKGDKDPVVIEWCRANMSPDHFASKYHHRGIK